MTSTEKMGQKESILGGKSSFDRNVGAQHVSVKS